MVDTSQIKAPDGAAGAGGDYDLHACCSDNAVFYNRLEMVAVCCTDFFHLVDRQDEMRENTWKGL